MKKGLWISCFLTCCRYEFVVVFIHQRLHVTVQWADLLDHAGLMVHQFGKRALPSELQMNITQNTLSQHHHRHKCQECRKITTNQMLMSIDSAYNDFYYSAHVRRIITRSDKRRVWPLQTRAGVSGSPPCSGRVRGRSEARWCHRDPGTWAARRPFLPRSARSKASTCRAPCVCGRTHPGPQRNHWPLRPYPGPCPLMEPVKWRCCSWRTTTEQTLAEALKARLLGEWWMCKRILCCTWNGFRNEWLVKPVTFALKDVNLT